MVTERLASKNRQARDLPQRPHLHHAPTRKATDGHADRQARDGRRLEMCAGVSQRDARFARIRNTLKLRRIYASEALLPEVEKNERLHIVEEARSTRFGDDGALV